MTEVQRYRPRNVELEARQFDGTNGPELAEWCGGDFMLNDPDKPWAGHIRWVVDGGTESVWLNDWIVHHPTRFAPWSDDAFRRDFEPVPGPVPV